jgi:hypothetical protein
MIEIREKTESPVVRPVDVKLDGVKLGDITPSIHGDGSISWMASLQLPDGRNDHFKSTHTIGHGASHSDAIAAAVRDSYAMAKMNLRHLEEFAVKIGLQLDK